MACDRLSRDHPPLVHARRHRRLDRLQPRRSCESAVRWGLQMSPGRHRAGRGVGDRLEGVRARGDARPGRQRRHHLLDRERRPDGRAHRRLDHGGAGPDADRQGVPAACATPPIAIIREIGVETGGSNIQFAVNPADGRHGRHRDEPARVALARRSRPRPPASRSPRSPPSSPSATRSTRSGTTSRARRRRRFEPAIDYCVVKFPRWAFEKFPRPTATLDDPDEVGGRGHGDRAHVQGGPPEVDPLARAGPLGA